MQPIVVSNALFLQALKHNHFPVCVLHAITFLTQVPIAIKYNRLFADAFWNRFGVWGLGFVVWSIGFGVKLNSAILHLMTRVFAAARRHLRSKGCWWWLIVDALMCMHTQCCEVQ